MAVTIDADGITWRGDDGTPGHVARPLLRRGGHGKRPTLHRTDQPDWRLVFDDPRVFDDPTALWLRRLPDVGAFSARARALYAGAVAATLAVGLGLWLFGDRLLEASAPLVPHRVTLPIGDALVGSLGGTLCHAPAGDAALDRLLARLRPAQGFVEPVQVSVLDTPAVNALAAPGGRIVIFRGLIDKAQNPDEVAGVLAHELTHVALRHPTKALLRQMGVSLLLRSIGGDVGGAADLAVLLQSSRQAERAADAGALGLLRAAHISPQGLATFFVRMRAADKAADKDRTERLIDLVGSYAATHPGDSERAAAVTAALPQQGAVTAAMTAADWQALRTICGTAA